MHLAIGALLLLVLSTTCAAYGPRGPDLRHVNQMRKTVGEKAGIEMPELTWDEGLAAEVKVAWDCYFYAGGPNFTFIRNEPDANAAKKRHMFFAVLMWNELETGSNYTDSFKTKLKNWHASIRSYKEINEVEFEFLNPAQKTVGCRRMNCTIEYSDSGVAIYNPPGTPDEFKFEGNTLKYDSVCYLGPSSKWTLEHFNLVAKGAAKVEAARKGDFGINLDSSAPEPEPSTTTTTAAPVPQTVPQEPVPEPEQTPVDPEPAPDAPAAPEESSSSTCGTFLLALLIIVLYL